MMRCPLHPQELVRLTAHPEEGARGPLWPVAVGCGVAIPPTLMLSPGLCLQVVAFLHICLAPQ